MGGITSINESIRKSVEYGEWRAAIFKRDHYTCLKCGNIGGKLVVHHTIPLNILISENLKHLMFDLDNGITLCKKCHKNYHEINGYKSYEPRN